MSSSAPNVQCLNVEISGNTYCLNLSDVKDFLQSCEKFMSIDDNEFEIMTQTISDTIIDCASPDLTIESLRPQLKFLREVGLLLNNMIAK